MLIFDIKNIEDIKTINNIENIKIRKEIFM